ncbi:Uncharacterised protein [Bordetella pertussis]|nr:Uncharacterised protein [Bordetella pertussis]
MLRMPSAAWLLVRPASYAAIVETICAAGLHGAFATPVWPWRWPPCPARHAPPRARWAGWSRARRCSPMPAWCRRNPLRC